MKENTILKDRTILEESLKHLESSKEAYIETTTKMINADNRNLYPLDLFMLGIVKRAILLTKGFCILMRQNNFLSSAPLIRLHIDNLLQVYAASIVKNPHDFYYEKLKGRQTNELEDKDMNKMTDRYLAEKISEEKETSWVINLYKETSKFVHVSDKHLFSVVEKVEEEGVLDFVISEEQTIPGKYSIEATQAMTKITEQLLRYVYGWIETKN